MNLPLLNVHPRTFSLEEFKGLSRQGPDFLLDVEKIQQGQNARMQNPQRICEGRFTVAIDGSQQVNEREAQDKLGQWINMKEKQGLRLVSDIRVDGPLAARDDNGVVVLGRKTYTVKAIFEHVKTPEPVRIELNPAVVKRDPEHRLSLAQARKAWNVRAWNPRTGLPVGVKGA